MKRCCIRGWAKYGIHGTVPGTDQDRALVIKLIDQLQAGESHGAAEQVQRIAERSLSTNSGKRQAVCLSCTELPLAFPGLGDASTFEIDGVLYLNTTFIHAKAAFEYAVSSNDG